MPVAPSGECSRGSAGAVDSIAVRRVWQQFIRLNPSVHSAALRGGCWYCMIAQSVIVINEDYYYYYYNYYHHQSVASSKLYHIYGTKTKRSSRRPNPKKLEETSIIRVQRPMPAMFLPLAASSRQRVCNDMACICQCVLRLRKTTHEVTGDLTVHCRHCRQCKAGEALAYVLHMARSWAQLRASSADRPQSKQIWCSQVQVHPR